MEKHLFRTALKAKRSPLTIDLRTPVTSLGSCFADHIGQKLLGHKFNISDQSLGTVFSPIAAFKLLGMVAQDEGLSSDGFVTNSDGVWAHYDLHSSFNALSLGGIKSRYEQIKTILRARLKPGCVIIITLGTAYQYVRNDTSQPVTNCHKTPSYHFRKELLTVAQIMDDFRAVQQLLPADTRYVVTVSPVRHTKDTMELNAVSKSILRLACHELSQLDAVHYFPSYELMLDDLRDYRFYKEDMIHPSDAAIAYIWDYFGKCYFDKQASDFVREWSKIIQGLAHRPLFPSSASHLTFLKSLLSKLEHHSSLVDVSHETAIVQEQMRLSDPPISSSH